MNFIFRYSAVLFAGAAAFAAFPAHADKIKHPTAVFNGLDKITGRIKSFEVAIDETAQFGTLQITPRVCFSRPATEAPRTDVFAEVDEVQPDKSLKRIFGGWMFADSPGLHGIEHPVYDIWLLDCKGDGPLIHEEPEVAETPDDSDDDPNALKTGDAGAPANPAPQPTQTKKPKKPKYDAYAAPRPNAPLPLDLTGSGANAPAGSSGRGGHFGGGDAGPIPPGYVGQ